VRLLKKDDTSKAIVFLMVDSTDHITGKTGLTPTVTISKNGGTFASPSGTVSEIGNGWYKFTPAAADVDTLGPLLIHATATGADPVDVEYRVVAFDPDAATNLGLSYLDEPISNIESQITGPFAYALSGSVVSDGANSTISFKTDLTGDYTAYRGMFLLFTSGNNQGISREIVDFDDTNQIVEVNVDFPEVPSSGDTFVLAGYSGR